MAYTNVINHRVALGNMAASLSEALVPIIAAARYAENERPFPTTDDFTLELEFAILTSHIRSISDKIRARHLKTYLPSETPVMLSDVDAIFTNHTPLSAVDPIFTNHLGDAA